MQNPTFLYSALNFPAENVDIFSKALKRNVAKLFTRALGINSSKQNNMKFQLKNIFYKKWEDMFDG